MSLLKKAHRRGEHCSPETQQSSLRLASSSVEEPKEKSPLLEEMPGRAGGYIILGITPETRPAEFARSSLSAFGLQTPLFAFSCVCSVGILGVCSGRGFCFYIAFATQKVSSYRGDARQGRGVDLSLLKREM